MFNLKHQFNDKGKELTFDADYVRYDSKGFNSLDTRYFTPDGKPDGTPDIIRNNMPALINIGVAKMDYAQPVGKGKFEAGLKSSYVKSDNNMIFETFDDTWQLDPSRTNQFKYTENINAGYANFNGQNNSKNQVPAGFTVRNIRMPIGNSVTLNSIRDRNYFNLFPSVFLSRNLDSSNVLNLSYSYRIDRPNYQSLNPFEYIWTRIHSRKVIQTFVHSIRIRSSWCTFIRVFLNTTLAYSRIKDMIADEVPMLIPEENKTYVTAENLDHQNYVSLTISAPIPVTKWWNVQTNVTGA